MCVLYFSTDAYIGSGTGLQVPLPGLKRPEHEVDHRPLVSASVMNEWRYSPLPLYILMAEQGELYQKVLVKFLDGVRTIM